MNVRNMWSKMRDDPEYARDVLRGVAVGFALTVVVLLVLGVW